MPEESTQPSKDIDVEIKSQPQAQSTDKEPTTTRDWNKLITAIVFFFLALVTWYIIKIFIE